MTKSFARKGSVRSANYRDPRALNEYVDKLMAEGRNWRQHGVYVETLDGGTPIAMLNEMGEFNPASVIKLATTLAALDKLGLDYRFRTELRADGQIDAQSGELFGDLILLSGGDPSFSDIDAQQVGEALRASGIRRVNGSLIVVGPFTCDENASTNASAGIFARHAGIYFQRPARFETYAKYRPRGQALATVESDNLLNIVHYLNSRSVNAMAEMLAMHIGGPKGIQKFLVESIGMPGEKVYISHGSGLEVNRLTPRDTVKMLRAMMEWLSNHRLKPSAVMAVAGMDAGTLRGRFGDGKFAGSVVAKTGTLITTDTGVAALAGVMYTRQCGPLLFAVYDVAEGQKVPQFRRLQDELLRKLVGECGGPDASVNRGRGGRSDRPQSRLIVSR